MALQIRWISLLLRKMDSAREGARILKSFEEWRHAQQALPAPSRSHDGLSRHKLIVIRLDDIGDYLLFRNQLPSYRESARWNAHHITLLGNESWRELFEAFDRQAVDEVIWVNKSEALRSSTYRLELWRRLRAQGFETVIAPSRTRPLLLDDLCTLAAAPARAIGAVNTYVHQSWNRVSDGFYHELFQPANSRMHEFSFNGAFAAWCCDRRFERSSPQLELPMEPVAGQTPSEWAGAGPVPYIVCFVGATTRSKRWPVSRWIEFIELYLRTCSGRVLVAGNSPREIEAAALIEARTGAQSVAGRMSLLELFRCVAGARGVISNDSMAAHLGVSCNRPTVIVANGVNYERFTDYAEAGINGVATVYPGVFTRRRKRLGDIPYHYPQAVSQDMASIEAGEVLEALLQVLNENGLPFSQKEHKIERTQSHSDT
jgi:ADP-heptose:LPS heptosyltransferase